MAKDEAGDFRATLNLPRTDFPMKADLPRREPEIQRRWQDSDLYGQIRVARRGAPRFVLHDGPPYVNGNIHMGHALNKSLKDFVVRYHTMRGEDAPYVPGWDTHGLPIELQALRRYHLERDGTDALEIRRRCREFALSFLDTMTAQFRRLGILGDWEHPYVTLDPEFEAAEIAVFGAMAMRGLIHRGLRPVYWCVDCATALAEAEVEFQETEGPSITVLFPVRESGGRLPAGTRAAIWTTTPWTLPANVAIALHPDLEYVVLRTPGGPLLCAETLAQGVWASGGLGGSPDVVLRILGRDLEGVICRHPLVERDSPLVLADYVSAEEGTGLVHTAPGHGREDFETGQRLGLPVIQPLDDRGRFGPEWGALAGLSWAAANPVLLKQLERAGALWAHGVVRHEYAHCWRCKQPLIWRATRQWFADFPAFRDETIAAIHRVRWHPAWGEQRMVEMVSGRQEWCLSRQRVWGVPVPVLHCRDCDAPLVEEAVLARVVDVVRREGADAWWSRPAQDFLPPGQLCPQCGGGTFVKDPDILDVWFDSGCSHAGVLARDPDLGRPADVYLEGPDQYRGWFQSSLLTAVATTGQAPYRDVVTNGWVLDGQGRAMHKSLGNVIQPEELLARYGADVLRLWVASVDYTADVRVSPEIMAQVGEVYRKLRNTVRFLLGNLRDFAPGETPRELPDPDMWILHRLGQVLARSAEAYREYRFNNVYHLVHDLCVQDLSSLYLDVAKDRLYCDPADGARRRATQAALYELARGILTVLAPILPHTTEEAWGLLPHRPGDPGSVHLLLWPEPPATWQAWATSGGEQRWESLRRLREAVSRAVEAQVGSGGLPRPAAAATRVALGPSQRSLLDPLAGELADLLLVASVDLVPGPEGEMRVVVEPTRDPRCPRCWRHRPAADAQGLCARCAGALASAGAQRG